MRELQYVKYNNQRAPRFQTRTAIVREDGRLVVEKSPLTEEGFAHIASFADKHTSLAKLYRRVQPSPVTLRGDTAVFPYVEGQVVGSRIEALLERDIDAALSLLRDYLARIGDYDDAMRVPFAMTDAFAAIFGALDYRGDALAVANLDEIFDNFLETDVGLSLIDYEWTFSFPVPIRFIRFRTLYYFLVKNYAAVIAHMSEEAFLEAFDYDTEETALWKQADDRFQQYVHGTDRAYIYTPRYERDIHGIHYLLSHVADIGQEFANAVQTVHDQSATIDDMRVSHDRAMAEKDAVIRTQQDWIEELEAWIRPKNYPKYLWKRFKDKMGGGA